MPGHARAGGHTSLILLLACAPEEEAPWFPARDDSAEEGQELDREGMVDMGSFWIDAFEATIEGDLGHGNQGAGFPDGSTTGVARSLRGVVPTDFVTWYQAFAACENAGKRLCTVTEWQQACGTATYPWGETPAPYEVCAIPDLDGNTAWTVLQPTGSRPDCQNGLGVYDQAGNAWEWADPQTTDADGFPVTAKLGGAYYEGEGSAVCASSANTEHPPRMNGIIAARCCAD